MSLHHVTDTEPGLTRQRSGRGFNYRDANGRTVRDSATLARIRALAIPPAWTRVWIAPDANGHIQATGRDAKGRKQYRYHVAYRARQDGAKYTRLVEFCRVLPKIREAVARDLACSCLCKPKVVATIVALLERAQLRIGNEEYARTNGSFGATTLRDRHAKITGDTLVLHYRGKSGVERHVRVADRRLATIVRRCRDLPGQRLFQYVDAGRPHPILSTDVNDYLRDVSGGPFSAKDYRTWAATLGAAALLAVREHPGSERGAKRVVREVCETIAARLGHTPAICRASYIHPRVIDDFAADTIATAIGKPIRRRLTGDGSTIDELRAIEPVVARYLEVPARVRRRA